MRARRAATALALAGAALATAGAAPLDADEAEEIAAARALFERNLDSIRRRDRDAYLACYLQSPRLVRTGPQGFSLGYPLAQTGWADGRPDALDVRDRHPYESAVAELRDHPERFFRSLLCSGVTAAFDVGGYPWTLRLGERAALDPRAPRVAAAGPLLSTLDHWVNLPGERQFLYLSDQESARGGARYLASEGAAAAKVWFIVTGERPFAEIEAAVRAAGDEARRAGLPLIVHATGLAEAKAAVRAGARLLVHSVWDERVDDEFLRLAKEAGTIYCPTLTVARGYVRMFEAAAAARAPEVDDANRCVHPSVLARVAETAELGAKALPAERLSVLGTRISKEEVTAAENLRRVRDAGIPIALGTDAGNPLTLHGPSVYAEAEAMQAAGMTAMEVLVAATQGGARAMAREKELGTVEAGKAADLLVLAADPTRDVRNLRQLRSVVRGGELRAVAELRPPSRGVN